MNPRILAPCLLVALAALPASATHGDHDVAVSNFEFTDAESGDATTRVPVGATVTWTWVSGTHSVTSGAHPALDPLVGAGFDSGNRATPLPDEEPVTFSRTFTQPGAYPYYCKLHAGMRGVVVVG